MAAYILRNLDPDFWTRVKTRAAEQGLPVKALILALLEGYLAGTVQIEHSSPRVKESA